MKKYFRNLNMLVILLLAGFVIAGTCGNVLAGSPAPTFTQDPKPSGPAISGTLTYFFEDLDGDGLNDYSLTNATCMGEALDTAWGTHEFISIDQIEQSTLLGNGTMVPTALLGDCLPPGLDPNSGVVTVFIRAVHSIKETADGNVTAEAVMLFLN